MIMGKRDIKTNGVKELSSKLADFSYSEAMLKCTDLKLFSMQQLTWGVGRYYQIQTTDTNLLFFLSD